MSSFLQFENVCKYFLEVLGSVVGAEQMDLKLMSGSITNEASFMTCGMLYQDSAFLYLPDIKSYSKALQGFT